MSMDPSRWVKTLPASNIKSAQEKYDLDSNRWINTLPKTIETNESNSIKKYSLTIILFAVGLMLVSVIKNETRNLQKEINSLQASVNNLQFDLHQTILDHEVITSPENISQLAKKYLETDLVFYQKSQLRQLNEAIEISNKLLDQKNEETIGEKNKDLKKKIKLKITKKIERTKTDLKKLQEIYSQPEKLPDHVRLQISKKINKKRIEGKTLISDPQGMITIEKIQKWGAIQVVKLFFGIPVIPGK